MLVIDGWPPPPGDTEPGLQADSQTVKRRRARFRPPDLVRRNWSRRAGPLRTGRPARTGQGRHADVTQQVGSRLPKPVVAGSIPVVRSMRL